MPGAARCQVMISSLAPLVLAPRRERDPDPPGDASVQARAVAVPAAIERALARRGWHATRYGPPGSQRGEYRWAKTNLRPGLAPQGRFHVCGRTSLPPR